MTKDYLPAIAGSLALLIAITFYGLAQTGPESQQSYHIDLKTQSTAAQSNLCTGQSQGVSYLIELENRIPTRKTDGITGFDAFGNKTTGDVYTPPVLLEKIGPIPCCFGLHRFFLAGQQVLEESWVGSIDKDYTDRPEGGVLFDKYQDFTLNGAFGAAPGTVLPGSYITYRTESKVIQNTLNLNDLESFNAGSLGDLLGSDFVDNSSQSDKNLRVKQTVKLTISGSGKVGFGDVNSRDFKDLSTGAITLNSFEADFNKPIFFCLDKQNNGICDNEECSPTTLCSDGLDNDNDGLIDFPSDPGCSSSDDTDETDPPPPPINRNITFTKQSSPQIVIQPALAEREVLVFDPPCPTCTVTTTPDHTQFVGGTPAADAGFVIIAQSVDSTDNSVSYTIVAVGNYEEHTQLYTVDGKEYTNIEH